MHRPTGRDWTNGDPLPEELARALRAAPDAAERFAALAPSHQREYVRWVADGRRADTRDRRAAQTVMRVLAGPPTASD